MESTDKSNPQEDLGALQVIPLPEEYLRCSRTHLVILISRMLSFLIQINDSNNSGKETMELTRFHSKAAPSITVYQYLIRLTKYSSLEHSVLLSAVYYIDLLSAVYPQFTLNSLTVHRFLLTATTIASKGLCDAFCTNTHYSKVGGVQCSELNILENEFLERVKYRIIPRDENIENCKLEYKLGLNAFIPPKENSRRGSNDGFNVLQNYYKKIVQLVGDPTNSPDKTSNCFFKLAIPMPSKENRNSIHASISMAPVTPSRSRLRNDSSIAPNMGERYVKDKTPTISTPNTVAFNKNTTSVSYSGEEEHGSDNENNNNIPISLPQKRNIKDDEPIQQHGVNSNFIPSTKKISSRFDS